MRNKQGLDVGTKLIMKRQASESKFSKLREEKENTEHYSFKPTLMSHKYKPNSSSIMFSSI